MGGFSHIDPLPSVKVAARFAIAEGTRATSVEKLKKRQQKKTNQPCPPFDVVTVCFPPLSPSFLFPFSANLLCVRPRAIKKKKKLVLLRNSEHINAKSRRGRGREGVRGKERDS